MLRIGLIPILVRAPSGLNHFRLEGQVLTGRTDEDDVAVVQVEPWGCRSAKLVANATRLVKARRLTVTVRPLGSLPHAAPPSTSSAPPPAAAAPASPASASCPSSAPYERGVPQAAHPGPLAAPPPLPQGAGAACEEQDQQHQPPPAMPVPAEGDSDVYPVKEVERHEQQQQQEQRQAPSAPAMPVLAGSGSDGGSDQQQQQEQQQQPAPAPAAPQMIVLLVLELHLPAALLHSFQDMQVAAWLQGKRAAAVELLGALVTPGQADAHWPDPAPVLDCGPGPSSGPAAAAAATQPLAPTALVAGLTAEDVLNDPRVQAVPWLREAVEDMLEAEAVDRERYSLVSCFRELPSIMHRQEGPTAGQQAAQAAGQSAGNAPLPPSAWQHQQQQLHHHHHQQLPDLLHDRDRGKGGRGGFSKAGAGAAEEEEQEPPNGTAGVVLAMSPNQDMDLDGCTSLLAGAGSAEEEEVEEQEPPKGAAGILDLPHELWVAIVSRLEPLDLARLRATCRGLAEAGSCGDAVPGVSLVLYPHQRAAVRWMVGRERRAINKNNNINNTNSFGNNNNNNPALLELLPGEFGEGGRYLGGGLWVDLGTAELRRTPPPAVPEVAGGFFCDEPGLGKTITALSLIIKTLGQLPRPPPDTHVVWTRNSEGRRVGFYDTGASGGAVSAGGSGSAAAAAAAGSILGAVGSPRLTRRSSSSAGVLALGSPRAATAATAAALTSSSSAAAAAAAASPFTSAAANPRMTRSRSASTAAATSATPGATTTAAAPSLNQSAVTPAAAAGAAAAATTTAAGTQAAVTPPYPAFLSSPAAKKQQQRDGAAADTASAAATGLQRTASLPAAPAPAPALSVTPGSADEGALKVEPSTQQQQQQHHYANKQEVAASCAAVGAANARAGQQHQQQQQQRTHGLGRSHCPQTLVPQPQAPVALEGVAYVKAETLQEEDPTAQQQQQQQQQQQSGTLPSLPQVVEHAPPHPPPPPALQQQQQLQQPAGVKPKKRVRFADAGDDAGDDVGGGPSGACFPTAVAAAGPIGGDRGGGAGPSGVRRGVRFAAGTGGERPQGLAGGPVKRPRRGSPPPPLAAAGTGAGSDEEDEDEEEERGGGAGVAGGGGRGGAAAAAAARSPSRPATRASGRLQGRAGGGQSSSSRGSRPGDDDDVEEEEQVSDDNSSSSSGDDDDDDDTYEISKSPRRAGTRSGTRNGGGGGGGGVKRQRRGSGGGAPPGGTAARARKGPNHNKNIKSKRARGAARRPRSYREETDSDDEEEEGQSRSGEEDEEEVEEEVDGLFVQCDRCGKWRGLPEGTAVSEGDPWFCHMHPVAAVASCSARPEGFGAGGVFRQAPGHLRPGEPAGKPENVDYWTATLRGVAAKLKPDQRCVQALRWLTQQDASALAARGPGLTVPVTIRTVSPGYETAFKALDLVAGAGAGAAVAAASASGGGSRCRRGGAAAAGRAAAAAGGGRGRGAGGRVGGRRSGGGGGGGGGGRGGGGAHTWRQAGYVEGLLLDLQALSAALDAVVASPAGAGGGPTRTFLSGATLVVLPPTIIDHWLLQIGKHVARGTLRVCVLDRADVRRPPSAAQLAWEHDLVITTFGCLGAAKGAECVKQGLGVLARTLMEVHWLRIILDEGHLLGSTAITNRLQMAVRLKAERRWVMTGTPTPATGSGSGAAHLQPLLSFLLHQPFGTNSAAWQEVVQRPLEAGRPEGRRRLMRLLQGSMIRASKADLVMLPRLIKRRVLLHFEADHAASYNELVEVVRRNLLTSDWCDEDHRESLLSRGQSKYSRQMMTNVWLSCCVAGSTNTVVKEEDLAETLQLLAGRLGHEPPAVLPGGIPVGPPFLLPGHPLWGVEESLRHGTTCPVCQESVKQPMVTPCGHVACLDCTAKDRERCPLPRCRAPYVMQGVEDPARLKDNPKPKWPVPKELIEWQPVYHQLGAQGIEGGHWSANWEVTKSSKISYMVRRLREVGAVPGKAAAAAASGVVLAAAPAPAPFPSPLPHPPASPEEEGGGSGGGSASGSAAPAAAPAAAAGDDRTGPAEGGEGEGAAAQAGTSTGPPESADAGNGAGRAARVGDGVGLEEAAVGGSAGGSGRSDSADSSGAGGRSVVVGGGTSGGGGGLAAALRRAPVKSKAIVFTQHGLHLQLIERSLLREEIPFKMFVHTFSKDQRDTELALFRNDPCCGVLVMDKVGAVGLDLSFVSYVLLMEPIVDSSLESQVLSRAHRMGAQRDVLVETLIMRGSVEEELLRLKTKTAGRQRQHQQEEHQQEEEDRQDQQEQGADARDGGAEGGGGAEAAAAAAAAAAGQEGGNVQPGQRRRAAAGARAGGGRRAASPAASEEQEGEEEGAQGNRRELHNRLYLLLKKVSLRDGGSSSSGGGSSSGSGG